MRKNLIAAVQFLLFLCLISGTALLLVDRKSISTTVQNWTGGSETGKNTNKKRGDKEVSIIVERAVLQEDKPVVRTIGTARAIQAVNITPEIAGTIVSVNVESGQLVDRNQTLIQLDDKKAQLAAQLAQTKLRQAELTLDRAVRLNKRNVGSAANVDDASIARDQAKLELSQALEVLADHKILAPFAGHVGIRKFEPGDRVTAQTTIFTLDDRSTLFVAFDLPEKNLSDIAVGTSVAGHTPSFPNKTIDGTITQIDSRIDTDTRTVRVRTNFDNKDDTLRPGMSFAITVNLPASSFIAVNELAVQWDNSGSYVWRIQENTAQKLPVTIIRRSAGKVLVSSDLSSGDLVVVEGVQRLREGRKVQFTPPKPLSTGPSAARSGQRSSSIQ